MKLEQIIKQLEVLDKTYDPVAPIAIREACRALKEYQRLKSENDLGVDSVSRKEVINQIFYSTDNNGDVVLGSALRERIARLPSVTPQEPKTGHWINIDDTHSKCDRCGGVFEIISANGEANYCPNCGAKMESEG